MSTDEADQKQGKNFSYFYFKIRLVSSILPEEIHLQFLRPSKILL